MDVLLVVLAVVVLVLSMACGYLGRMLQVALREQRADAARILQECGGGPLR